MNRLWHCFNCSTDFESPRDLCPQCGADGQDPRAGGIIAPRVVIHLDPPHAILLGRGLNTYACNPAIRVGSKGTRASGDPSAVNCPLCRETAIWKELDEASRVPHAYRIPARVAVPVMIEPSKETSG
jgi:hypothetical protein